jgi:EmrB/QacA subfamily drug resistance transporter
MSKWSVLIVLSVAQFLMVLDQSVMNVSISQLVADFDASVTTIQAVITLYSLVMAGLMISGGKLGDLWGRRRVFIVGLVIYGAGSLLTALSWSVPTLALGWSVLEGIGAAMVLPALVALTAGNYSGNARATAFGVLGGVAGAGIAVGPILGGWVTTNLTWRLVFAGEVVLVIAILVASRVIREAEAKDRPTELDWIGSVLSALGLGLIVFGALQASNWGWLEPRNSPVEPLGFSLTPFMIAAGAGTLFAFRAWERRREEADRPPLVRFGLFQSAHLRGGLTMFTAQNLILLGVFFTIPLYLQVVQGFDAFETGVRMLPVSIAMLLLASLGPRLASRWPPRAIVRGGLALLAIAVVFLLATIDPEIDDTAFAVAMTAFGAGLGLIASQLGNVVQSSVGERDRSEAGGLQFTA